jgi:Cytosine deaminase and related metal-dependent hydrolases
VLQTVLAHGVYLSDEELQVLVARGSSVSHCPNSNTSLKSGLCDVRRLLNSGIKVGLGTGMIHYRVIILCDCWLPLPCGSLNLWEVYLNTTVSCDGLSFYGITWTFKLLACKHTQTSI